MKKIRLLASCLLVLCMTVLLCGCEGAEERRKQKEAQEAAEYFSKSEFWDMFVRFLEVKTGMSESDVLDIMGEENLERTEITAEDVKELEWLGIAKPYIILHYSYAIKNYKDELPDVKLDVTFSVVEGKVYDCAFRFIDESPVYYMEPLVMEANIDGNLEILYPDATLNVEADINSGKFTYTLTQSTWSAKLRFTTDYQEDAVPYYDPEIYIRIADERYTCYQE